LRSKTGKAYRQDGLQQKGIFEMGSNPRHIFSKKAFTLGAILVLVMAVLSVLLLFEGPRIRRVDYDPTALTRQSNQTIILRSNQPLRAIDKSQVSIEPSVDFSVNSSGESVILQLKNRLNYQTSYKVTLHDIVSKKGRRSAFTTTITTGHAEYFVLKRNTGAVGQKQPDVIMQGGLDVPEKEVYSAYRIIDFGLLDDTLIVARQDQSGGSAITIYDMKKQTSKDIALPGKGSVNSIGASPHKKLFGFTFTSGPSNGQGAYNHSLFVYDIVAGIAVPIKGIGSDKVSVTLWKFHPDGTSIIAQTYSSGVLLLDSYSEQSPLPLGTYYSIGNFSRDGSRVVLGDAVKGPVVLNLQDKTKNLPMTSIRGSTPPLLTDARLMQDSTDMLKVLHTSSGLSSSRVFVLGDGQNDRPIQTVDNGNLQTYDYQLSSNDQYLGLELSVTSNRQFDAYSENPKPTNLKTTIIHTKDGSTAKIVDGFKLTWR
jgi:hypothetical protein